MQDIHKMRTFDPQIANLMFFCLACVAGSPPNRQFFDLNRTSKKFDARLALMKNLICELLGMFWIEFCRGAKKQTQKNIRRRSFSIKESV